MAIKTGDKLPEATFMVMTAEGPAAKTVADVFSGKKVALFAIPGAYTPTCQKQHVPGFVDRVDELKEKGIDTIACTAVNDAFVMAQFAKDTGADGKILMLADGNADFVKKIGLDFDGSGFGLGVRSKRYAMLALIGFRSSGAGSDGKMGLKIASVCVAQFSRAKFKPCLRCS
ncbi:MAG TPA: peroxiredoxin [Planctomycetes bacterium]|nr:peroxiredoxin [Planctomycetota bacterium]